MAKTSRSSRVLQPPAQQNWVVWVVDDDPAVRMSLKFALEMEGFVVHTFSDAQSVLRENGIGRHASLVVDYRLPDTNGLDLVQRLRAKGVVAPAVMITSHPSEDLRRRAAALSVPIIEKPLLDNSLIATIREQQQQQPQPPPGTRT